VWNALQSLKAQAQAGSEQVVIQCKFPPSKPPWFHYTLSLDVKERKTVINEKKMLLAQHYDNTKMIGAHAELIGREHKKLRPT